MPGFQLDVNKTADQETPAKVAANPLGRKSPKMKFILALSMFCLASGAVVKAAEVLRPRGVPLSSEFYVKNVLATSEECG